MDKKYIAQVQRERNNQHKIMEDRKLKNTTENGFNQIRN